MDAQATELLIVNLRQSINGSVADMRAVVESVDQQLVAAWCQPRLSNLHCYGCGAGLGEEHSMLVSVVLCSA